MKRFIVDRTEEDKAVLECEDGSTVSMDLKSLPPGIGEGDVIEFGENSCFLNSEETELRRKKIRGMMDKLFK